MTGRTGTDPTPEQAPVSRRYRIPIRLPRVLPYAYHPFEGTEKTCSYCFGPRYVHLGEKVGR